MRDELDELDEVALAPSRSSPGSVRWSRGVSPPWSSPASVVRLAPGSVAVPVATWALAGTLTGTTWEKEALLQSPAAAGIRATTRAARVMAVRFMTILPGSV